MSAEQPRPPAWGYVIAYPFDDEGLAATPKRALSCALALQRIAYLMALGMDTPETVEDSDDVLLKHVMLYGWAWTRKASELLEAERSAAAAAPPATDEPTPPGVLPMRRRRARAVRETRKQARLDALVKERGDSHDRRRVS